METTEVFNVPTAERYAVALTEIKISGRAQFEAPLGN
jgi:hypothetical protein